MLEVLSRFNRRKVAEGRQVVGQYKFFKNCFKNYKKPFVNSRFKCYQKDSYIFFTICSIKLFYRFLLLKLLEKRSV